MSDLFVADTYALVELAKRSEAYAPYRSARLIITGHAYVEFVYFALRTQSIGLKGVAAVSELVVEQDTHTLREAATLRHKRKEENLSYADCVGWAFAQRLGIPFLTGDKQFAGKPGVAFVR